MPKSLKRPSLSTFFIFKVHFVSTNIGRSGGFEEGLGTVFLFGSFKDFVLCRVGVSGLGHSICGRAASLVFRECYFAGIISWHLQKFMRLG